VDIRQKEGRNLIFLRSFDLQRRGMWQEGRAMR
jgi:hypothetical protein